MIMTEEIYNAIRDMAFVNDPESVCYIDEEDGEGYHVQEMDGDWCHGCATEEARRLDEECGGKYVHVVREETMPEHEGFAYCSNCGCLLDATVIVNQFAEDGINVIVEDLKKADRWGDVTGELAWKIWEFFKSDYETKRLFPKQRTYIRRRLTNLYNKNEI